MERTKAQDFVSRFNSYGIFEWSCHERRIVEEKAGVAKRLAGLAGRQLTSDEQEEIDECCSLSCEHGFIPRYPTVPRFIAWCVSNWVWYYTKHQVDRIICWKWGHKLADMSSAGPDSGNMDHECSRCGASWSVPLY